ncbi:Phosphoacetylglucosamine mutase [Thelohanellus kitauei]|uniref:Phosphoacetylglucosamine mutase n=1 Tax=Thelohanellus kitauei TaxID=669202 RepID=A0A0C2N1N6_THEKT|nr:Phosphoacetylglucosamine mutase [Thelohanellus kitauei]
MNYIVIKNDESCGDCGADYVYINQKPHESIHLFDKEFEFQANQRCVSFDGDADRIVYFYKQDEKCTVLNGDHMTVLNVEFSCAKTGVKYLHSAAKLYDIGIYFEANGHGTVLFQPSVSQKLAEVPQEKEYDNFKNRLQYNSAQKLVALAQIFNQTGSDALANLLALELILNELKFTLSDWNKLATFLPHCQLKLNVMNKELIKTSESETEVISPPELQKCIDEVLSHYEGARAFIRPSGTENVVRIYSEAKDVKSCEEICEKLKSLTLKYLIS